MQTHSHNVDENNKNKKKNFFNGTKVSTGEGRR